MSDARIDKTRDKTRRGGLPAPVQHLALLGRGDAGPCDGCGDPLYAFEKATIVTMPYLLRFRFHGECYNAWRSFTP